GGEDESAEGTAAADDRGDGGRREDAAATDQQATEAVGGGHADDRLGGLAVVEAPVAADGQRGRAEVADGGGGDGVEDRLHEVLEVAGLHEDARLLPQARSARSLPLERRRRNRPHVSLSHRSHGSPPSRCEWSLLCGQFMPFLAGRQNRGGSTTVREGVLGM